MKTLFLFLLLTAGPALAQTTFIVKTPDGKPAKDVVVYSREKEVAKTNEKGEAVITTKIGKGERLFFSGILHNAEYEAKKDHPKPVTIKITLREADQVGIPIQEMLVPEKAENTSTENRGVRGYAPVEPAPEALPAPPREIHTDLDEPAEFPGGNNALTAFLSKNLKYPETASEKEIEGKCHIRFVIDAEGTISDVKVLRGVLDCPECDQEAIRVVQMMPKWKPGKSNGKAVKSYYNLPVKFTIP